MAHVRIDCTTEASYDLAIYDGAFKRLASHSRPLPTVILGRQLGQRHARRSRCRHRRNSSSSIRPRLPLRSAMKPNGRHPSASHGSTLHARLFDHGRLPA